MVILVAGEDKNKTLADTIQNELNNTFKVTTLHLPDLLWPLFTVSKQKEHPKLNQFDQIIDEMNAADAFMVVSPEYNGGVPPVLTNFISWISVSSKDWRNTFMGKCVGIASFSGSSGAQLVAILRIQLAYLGLNVIGIPLMASYKKELNQDSLKQMVTQLNQLLYP